VYNPTTGGTISVVTSAPICRGTKAARVAATGGNQKPYLEDNRTFPTTVYTRALLYVDPASVVANAGLLEYSANNSGVLLNWDASGNMMKLILGFSGGQNTIGTFAAPAVGRWVCFELALTVGATNGTAVVSYDGTQLASFNNVATVTSDNNWLHFQIGAIT